MTSGAIASSFPEGDPTGYVRNASHRWHHVPLLKNYDGRAEA
ncbi:hypothetical protein AMST5_04210 [freshwater sediment metagenome]|uniref:Uncharacterized protein n=1 Tax=freshwater sediment metagenome TaxID=556182 RepID=A0AA48M593_9ZZZZ